MSVQYLVDTDWTSRPPQGQAGDHPATEVVGSRGSRAFHCLARGLIRGCHLFARSLQERARTPGVSSQRHRPCLDLETCRIFGRERGRLRAKKTLIGDFDLLIGATAIRHGLVLLTNNRRHFELGIQALSHGELTYPGVTERILTHPVTGLESYQEVMRLLEEKVALKVFVTVAG